MRQRPYDADPSARPTDPAVWTGRDDGDGPAYRRWYQLVNAGRGAGPGVAVVGFASDEGVRRNHGRPGAADGPDALRRALAPLAMHLDVPIVDAGTVAVEGGDLEGAQAALGRAVARLLDEQRLVVVLGGGHETAWGSYLGRAASTRLGGARVGVLNLDAHFDLRAADRSTSGTPFLQMARAEAARGGEFRYTVLGISEASNTAALFETADVLGVRYKTDEACATGRVGEVMAEVDALAAEVDAVHLSIDLDVLPGCVAPGVSAPAAYGVGLDTLLPVVRRVAGSGKLALVDVVELAPPFDADGRTARTAARLIHAIITTAVGEGGS